MIKNRSIIFIAIAFILATILFIIYLYSFKFYVVSSKVPEVLIKHAWELYDKKQYIKSIKELNVALKSKPNNKEIFEALGYNYFALKNYERTINNFSKANTVSAEAQHYLMIGYSYSNKKQNKDALETFKKAAELDPKKSEPYVNIAQIYFSDKEYEQAIKYFNKANTLSPTAESYVMIGHSYLQKKQNKDALEAFKIAAKLDTKKSEPFVNIAQIYFSQKDFNKALEYLIKANKLSPSCENYLMLGYCYLHKKQNKDAIEVFNKAVEMSSKICLKKADALFNMAQIYFSQKDYQQAIEYFIKANLLAPSEQNYLMLGYCYTNIGQYRSAIAAYKKSEKYIRRSKSTPVNKEFYSYQLGVLYKDYLHDKEKYKRGFKEFTHYLQRGIASNEINAYISMAEDYLFINDKNNYLKWIKKAEDIDKDNRAISKNLFVYYSRNYKDNDKALYYIDKLLSTASTKESYSLRKKRAYILIKQGRFIAATKRLNRLRELVPYDKDVISLFGQLYLEIGDYAALDDILPEIMINDPQTYYDIMYKRSYRNNDYLSALKYNVKLNNYPAWKKYE